MSGPEIAEQLHVILSACDHFARCCISTISAVITQTELTMPPPPIPAAGTITLSGNGSDLINVFTKCTGSNQPIDRLNKGMRKIIQWRRHTLPGQLHIIRNQRQKYPYSNTAKSSEKCEHNYNVVESSLTFLPTRSEILPYNGWKAVWVSI